VTSGAEANEVLTSPAETHVELRKVTKRFGGTQALAEVDLVVRRGLIHGLVGENGAGKSTLGKLIAGIHRPDTGDVIVDGESRSFRSPRQASSIGIASIAQELTLVSSRSVLDNVLLGVEPGQYSILRKKAMLDRFMELEGEAGFGLTPKRIVGELRYAERQKVEILRALARDARLIVMDEPTAALTDAETVLLFGIMERLRAQGKTIIFISHFLEQVLQMCDVVTVLRDGRVIRTANSNLETPATLVTGMLGRPLDLAFPEKAYPSASSPVVCRVKNLERRGIFRDVSFEVRAGEIFGLAGLVGSGRSEVARAIFGADRFTSGVVELDGKELRVRSPRDAIKAGIAMLPENRKEQGLLLEGAVAFNIALPHLQGISTAGVVTRRQETTAVRPLVERLGIRCRSVRSAARTLSGGNQQKVLFAKWLLEPPRLLIADEPTHGVDVGAKRAIYELIHELASTGMAMILISSEMEEVLGLAHRLAVMQNGRIVAKFDGHSATVDDVMAAQFAPVERVSAVAGVVDQEADIRND
jgi:rhamnose transport system ATP-binding protein